MEKEQATQHSPQDDCEERKREKNLSAQQFYIEFFLRFSDNPWWLNNLLFCTQAQEYFCTIEDKRYFPITLYFSEKIPNYYKTFSILMKDFLSNDFSLESSVKEANFLVSTLRGVHSLLTSLIAKTDKNGLSDFLKNSLAFF